METKIPFISKRSIVRAATELGFLLDFHFDRPCDILREPFLYLLFVGPVIAGSPILNRSNS